MWEWLLTPIDAERAHALSDARIWHARLMFTAWGILAPLGIFFARFLKVLPGQNWPHELDNPFWWRCHWIGQSAVVALSVIGTGLIILLADAALNWHGRLGYAVLLLAGVQVLLGIFRGSKGGPSDPRANGSLDGDHYNMTSWRRLFERAHKSGGYLALALACTVMISGLWNANAPRWMWLSITLWWCLLIGVFVVLQRRGLAIDTYQAIWGPDPAHPGNRTEAPGWGMQRRKPASGTTTSDRGK